MENSFASRLRLLREKESRENFAKKLGLSPRALVNYENGTRVPKSNLVSQICARLGININWLLTGKGPMYETSEGATANKAGDTSPVLPASSPAQPIENITSEKTKTGDMSPVWEVQRELTDALKKRAEAQERIVELTQENAELRLQLERRDMRIHELEKENAGLREAQKGSAPVFRAAAGEAG